MRWRLPEATGKQIAKAALLDLVVLDLNLPKIGGCEVLEALRQNADVSHLTVAVMTSSDGIAGLRKMHRIGRGPLHYEAS